MSEESEANGKNVAVDHVVMPSDTYAIEMAKNNAECLERLMRIIVNAMPHTHDEIVGLSSEWRRVQQEIDYEYFDI